MNWSDKIFYMNMCLSKLMIIIFGGGAIILASFISFRNFAVASCWKALHYFFRSWNFDSLPGKAVIDISLFVVVKIKLIADLEFGDLSVAALSLIHFHFASSLMFLHSFALTLLLKIHLDLSYSSLRNLSNYLKAGYYTWNFTCFC